MHLRAPASSTRVYGDERDTARPEGGHELASIGGHIQRGLCVGKSMFRWKKRKPEMHPAEPNPCDTEVRSSFSPPGARMTDEEFKALVAEMNRTDDCDHPPCLHTLNDEFRRAALTGKDVRGEVMLTVMCLSFPVSIGKRFWIGSLFSRRI